MAAVDDTSVAKMPSPGDMWLTVLFGVEVGVSFGARLFGVEEQLGLLGGETNADART